jgi:hypothetical protein
MGLAFAELPGFSEISAVCSAPNHAKPAISLTSLRHSAMLNAQV